jgi:hypothetical protein
MNPIEKNKTGHSWYTMSLLRILNQAALTEEVNAHANRASSVLI